MTYSLIRRTRAPKRERSWGRILVTGCARSGTRYITEVLRYTGVRVVHEAMGQEGLVCSFFAVDTWYYPSPHRTKRRRGTEEFGLVWHQIRHPLSTISSVHWAMSPQWWSWIEKITGIEYEQDPIERCAKYWVYWNEMIEADPQVTLRYRVEDMPWDEMQEQLGVRAPMPKTPTNIGTTHHRKVQLEWADLGAMEDRVRKLAEHYGY